jgi:uncharacterized protein
VSRIEPGVFVGKVVHKRLRPTPHHLNYTVASVLVDVDRLNQLPSLMGYNRFSLFGIYDADYGKKGSGQKVCDFAWSAMREAGAPPEVVRILKLSYPRILGYSFNPLTVYFGLDADSKVRMVLYEVHNTFGGRHVYPAGPFGPDEQNFAHADKALRVSPFNKVEGSYGLKVSAPLENVAVGVTLSTAEGPLLNAYFKGDRKPLTNAILLRVFFGLPLMTVKVMAGIHWEALKLWAKGLKVQSP